VSEPLGARLVWETAEGLRREFPLSAPSMTVGREEGVDIQIDEPLVSRVHARIERRGEGFVLVDLESTNRTRVNGDVVSEVELHPGDEVRFARARCTFLGEESAAPAGEADLAAGPAQGPPDTEATS
jgi:hypothetical protein